jgi:hypothetical protein
MTAAHNMANGKRPRVRVAKYPSQMLNFYFSILLTPSQTPAEIIAPNPPIPADDNNNAACCSSAIIVVSFSRLSGGCSYMARQRSSKTHTQKCISDLSPRRLATAAAAGWRWYRPRLFG